MGIADTLFDAAVEIRDEIENHGIDDYCALAPEILRVLDEMDRLRIRIDRFCDSGDINPVVEADTETRHERRERLTKKAPTEAGASSTLQPFRRANAGPHMRKG